MSLLANIPPSRYFMSGLALFKVSNSSSAIWGAADLASNQQLCSLLPPFRETLPPPTALYLLILLSIVDLQAGNLVLSAGLNACHGVGLWWIGRG